MRVKIAGVHTTTKTLADGTRRKYFYLGKGGPRLEGEPGSSTFVASIHAAKEALKRVPPNTLSTILDAYRSSDEFKDKKASTSRDYTRHLKAIEAEFGQLPLAALGARQVRQTFKAWRSEIEAASGARTADYVFQVFAAVLAWANDESLIEHHPLKRIGRRYKSARRDKVWTRDVEADFMARAPAHMRLPLLLALWTGQRQGDILKMTWADYDGACIRVHQDKGGDKVQIRVGAPLKAALDAENLTAAAKAAKRKRPQSPYIVTNLRGAAWTSDGFRTSWRKAVTDAGIEGLTFNDTRGSAVTRLGEAGCEVIEIASVTGHSLKSVEAILDNHYLSRTQRIADNAIAKRETAESSKPDSKPSPNAVSLQTEEAL